MSIFKSKDWSMKQDDQGKVGKKKERLHVHASLLGLVFVFGEPERENKWVAKNRRELKPYTREREREVTHERWRFCACELCFICYYNF